VNDKSINRSNDIDNDTFCHSLSSQQLRRTFAINRSKLL
jgi:hypothetical protein